MSDDVPLGFLAGILALLICLSAFFSGSETALMALNRYRNRHKARSGHRGARLAESLLQRPDRLITLILFGNNLVNFSAATLASYLTLRLFGSGAWITAAGTFVFTLVVLIFAEVMPKTLAALHPERLAYPASFVYYPLQTLAFPLIWLISRFSNGLLRLAGVNPEEAAKHSLTIEELRVVVNESAALIPRKRRHMLQAILSLDGVTVDDIMVPHNEIAGIDIEEPWEKILLQINSLNYTRLPVYRDDIDNITGILDLRRLIRGNVDTALDKQKLLSLVDDPYFVPEGTPLHRQLVQFQQHRQRTALIVDEYGDIQGLLTLEDILQEIVGEFDNQTTPKHLDVQPEAGDTTFVVNASANIRSLNRTMNWHLPTDGARTLNGLILEQLGTIPEQGTAVALGDYAVDILQTSDNAINQVRLHLPEHSSTAAA